MIREIVARMLCVLIACILGLTMVSFVMPVASSESIEISTDMPPLPFERLAAGVVLGDDDRIYVFGGYRYNYTSWDTTLNTVMIYNITTGMTTYGSSMASGAAWPSCAKLPDGRIVVIGGYDSAVLNGTKVVRIYNPQTDTWTVNATAPTNITRAGTALGLDGNVYVFGPSGSQNSTLIYDPVNDAWSYGADLYGSRSRYSSSVVTYNETAIYVIGGFHFEMIWVFPPGLWMPYWFDTDYVDVYNPVTDTWTTGPSLNRGKYAGGAALARDGLIHYYGGQQWLGVSYDEIETLEVSTPGATWQLSDYTLSKEKAHFGTVVDEHGRVFVVGGMDYPGSAGIDEVEMLMTAEVSEVNEISIVSPMDGAGVNGTVEIEVEAKNLHAASVVVVDAYVDDVLLESQLGGGATSWTYVWNATELGLDSSHSILVRAFFDDGTVSEDEALYTIAAATTDDDIGARLSQIEENLTAAIEAISGLSVSIVELQNLTSWTLENLSLLQDDLASIRDDLLGNLTQVEEEIGGIQSQLDTLANAIAELESSTATDLSDLSDDLNALSELLDELTATVLDVQTALDGLAQQPGPDLDEVMNDLDSLMDAIEDLNHTVEDIDGMVGDAQVSADDARTYALMATMLAVLVLAVIAASILVLRGKR